MLKFWFSGLWSEIVENLEISLETPGRAVCGCIRYKRISSTYKLYFCLYTCNTIVLTNGHCEKFIGNSKRANSNGDYGQAHEFLHFVPLNKPNPSR